jgi:hypothetical protein
MVAQLRWKRHVLLTLTVLIAVLSFTALADKPLQKSGGQLSIQEIEGKLQVLNSSLAFLY